METLAEPPFIGDQVGLYKAQPGRPQRNAIPRAGDADTYTNGRYSTDRLAGSVDSEISNTFG